MTPDQIRHLHLIEAHLDKLLAIASQRTTGKWRKEASRAYCADDEFTYNVVGPPSDYMYLQEEGDASFIAACAGNAEAGWVATKGMIMLCRSYDELSKTITTPLTLEATNIACDSLLETILIAWPLELLS
jgi:hypothetical protein